jgi:hypothetical protein
MMLCARRASVWTCCRMHVTTRLLSTLPSRCEEHAKHLSRATRTTYVFKCGPQQSLSMAGGGEGLEVGLKGGGGLQSA